MEQVYPSKVDIWLGVVLGGTIALSLVGCGLSLQAGILAAMAVIIPVVLLGVAFPLWIVTSTRYTLNNTTLLVQSGPFHWHIPIQAITHITPTTNPLSSPALSLDRLRIDYGSGRSLLISPKNKGQFLRALETRCG